MFIVTGKVESFEDLLPLLKEVRNARQEDAQRSKDSELIAGEPTRQEVVEAGERTGGRVPGTLRPASELGDRQGQIESGRTSQADDIDDGHTEQLSILGSKDVGSKDHIKAGRSSRDGEGAVGNNRREVDGTRYDVERETKNFRTNIWFNIRFLFSKNQNKRFKTTSDQTGTKRSYG